MLLLELEQKSISFIYVYSIAAVSILYKYILKIRNHLTERPSMPRMRVKIHKHKHT